ncbi:Arc family DNA-binding protein [Methylobacterium komagatae]|uniref:Arc family DNA-binding protein n=1 Tax=Methylobacterium komagatae TaxID=374425 RepID=A0ABW2BJG7_9HYPH
MLRFPDGMRARLAERAQSNLRSMNSEVVMILAAALSDEGKPATGGSLQANAPAAGPNDTALQGSPATHG